MEEFRFCGTGATVYRRVTLRSLNPSGHMLLASLTLLFAPALPAQGGAVDLPSGLPFPTLRPTTYDLHDLASGEAEMEPERLWHYARPHMALTGQGDWNFAQARAERAEALADINGWDRDERMAWAAATAPKPVILRYRIIQGEQQLSAGAQPILPGTPVTLGHAVQQRVVADFNVEIAQNSTIVDPDIRLAFTGAQVGLVAVPLDGQGWWLETCVVIARQGEAGTINLGHPGMVGKSRDERMIQEFSGSILLLPQTEQSIELGNGIKLQFTIDAAPGPGKQAAGQAIRVDVPSLGLSNRLDQVLEDFESSIVWAHPSGLLLLDADSGARAADEILRIAGQASLVDLQLQEQGASSATLLKLRGVSGSEYRFASGRAADIIADWDVEVASRARLADPQFDRIFVGWSGSMGAELAGGTLSASRCNAVHSGVINPQPTPLVLAAAEPGADGKDGQPAVTGMINQLSRWSTRFQFVGPIEEYTATRSVPAGARESGAISLKVGAVPVR